MSLIPQEYLPLARIILFAIINCSVYLAMAYSSHVDEYDSIFGFMQSPDFQWKEAGRVIALLIALSTFIFMALNKFASKTSLFLKTTISALVVPVLMVTLFYYFMK